MVLLMGTPFNIFVYIYIYVDFKLSISIIFINERTTKYSNDQINVLNIV